MTYFATKLAELEKGCGYDGSKYGQMVLINGTLDYAKCNDKTKCSECQAKIQQLKSDEEEVRKAIEEHKTKQCACSKDECLKAIERMLGISGEKDG